MQAYDLSFALPVLRQFSAVELSTQSGLITDVLQRSVNRFSAWLDLAKGAESSDEPHGSGPRAHNMFLYRLRRAVWAIEHDLGPHGLVRDDLVEPLTALGERLDSMVLDRFYYLVAMCSAVRPNESDSLQLGFALYTLRRYSSIIMNDVVSEHAVGLVADALIGQDAPPRLENILRTNDSVVSVTPVQLLGTLAKLDLVQQRYESVAHVFEGMYRWVRATERVGLIGPFESGTPAWMQEPWRGSKVPEAWINAAVVDFLKNYASLLRSSIGRDLSVDFGASERRPSVSWDQLLDYRSTKADLRKDLIDPILQRKPRDRRPFEKCSAILFGPPGTAKTTFAKALAWELGWPFIEFKPHHFAMDGEDGVVRSIAVTFRRLLMMRECVVFFDEIDELVTTRDDPQGTKLDRFITTSVLPWLQELRDRGEIVFIVATNHVERFDPAVKRPGRFDFVLPIGTPDKAARSQLLARFLSEAAESRQLPVEEIVGAYNASDLEQKDGDRVTLGELRQIALTFAGLWTDNTAAGHAMQSVCSALHGRLLIDVDTMSSFEDSQARYRFPAQPGPEQPPTSPVDSAATNGSQ